MQKKSVDFFVCQEEPGIQNRIRVKRYGINTLIHQPFCEIRMVRWSLATDANVLICLFTRLNSVGQKYLDGLVPLVEQVRNNTRVTIQTKSKLGQVIGADRETIKVLKELVCQQRVARQFAHHDHP